MGAWLKRFILQRYDYHLYQNADLKANRLSVVLYLIMDYIYISSDISS